MRAKQVLQKAYYTSRIFLKRNAPTILTCIGAGGVIGTAVLAVRATPKALQRIEVARDDKGEELTTLEVVQVAGTAYLPAVLMGLSTMACIFGANAINQKRQAALISAYTMLDSSYKEYKNKVKELYGEGATEDVEKAIVKDKYSRLKDKPSGEKVLFYEDHYGKFFESTIEDVLSAEYHFNRNFVLRGYAALNEFLEFLGVGPVKGGDAVGWSIVAGGMYYGYSWVDFTHQLVVTDDGLECYAIDYPFPPTEDYLDLDYGLLPRENY